MTNRGAAGVCWSSGYDGCGNLQTEFDGTTTTTYTVDARDHLAGITDGTTPLAYTYDAGGRCIGRFWPEPWPR